MKFIGFDREDEAAEWAKAKIGIDHDIGFCRALTMVDKNDDFGLVVVFSNFTPRNVDVHIAAKDRLPVKAFIEIFNRSFSYIFDELKAVRATGLVRASDTVANRFNQQLGFKLEGILRQAFENDDLNVYGFLNTEFKKHRWYYGR